MPTTFPSRETGYTPSGPEVFNNGSKRWWDRIVRWFCVFSLLSPGLLGCASQIVKMKPTLGIESVKKDQKPVPKPPTFQFQKTKGNQYQTFAVYQDGEDVVFKLIRGKFHNETRGLHELLGALANPETLKVREKTSRDFSRKETLKKARSISVSFNGPETMDILPDHNQILLVIPASELTKANAEKLKADLEKLFEKEKQINTDEPAPSKKKQPHKEQKKYKAPENLDRAGKPTVRVARR